MYNVCDANQIQGGGTMHNNSLPTREIRFKEIEKELFEVLMETGRQILKTLIEEQDFEIMKEIDKKKYRNRGKRKNTIKTTFGEVEYQRRVYEFKNEEGKKSYVYPLDQALQLDTIGKISITLVEKIIENATNESYRKTATNISTMTGQTMSHTAAWNIVQAFGKKLEEEEKKQIEANNKRNSDEIKKDCRGVRVLFVEADGIYLNMQGKDRGKRKGKKQELKCAVTYEGWGKRYPGSKEYETVNKTVVAGFASSKDFSKLLEASISEKYNREDIELMLLNGDGAKWIKECTGDAEVIYQLDRYHVHRDIIRYIWDKKAAKQMIKWLKEGDVEQVLKRIEELKYECDGEADKIKKLLKIEKYLKGNKEGLIPYQKRDRIKVPEPPEGIYYRNMGTMEHQICDVIALRMKGRKMSWSKHGANSMAKILASKASKTLYQKLDALMRPVLPETFIEKFDEAIKNVKDTASEIKIKIPKVYHLHKGKMPFSSCKMTNSRHVLRNMFNWKHFTEIRYT